MKYTITTLLAIGLPFLSSCGDKNTQAKDEHAGHDHASHEGHDHEGHDHADHEGEGHEGHDHGDHEGHDHGDHHGHEHVKAGPNGGRMIAEANAEFFVTDSRNVQVTFYGAEDKATSPEGKSVIVLTGERSAPFEMSFKVDGDHLISEQAIPAGNNFPTVVEIDLGGDKKVEEKFTLNLNECPKCDNKEYACECEH